LRPDRQQLRLVCLHPRQPRRATLAEFRERCRLLMLAGWPIMGRRRAAEAGRGQTDSDRRLGSFYDRP
jgi:hypothetical protein